MFPDSPTERSAIVSVDEKGSSSLLNECDITEEKRINSKSWRTEDGSRALLFTILSVLTGGLLNIVCIANPTWKVYLTTSQCAPGEASMAIVLVPDNSSTGKVETLAVTVGNRLLTYCVFCCAYVLLLPVEKAVYGGEVLCFVNIKCRRYVTNRATSWRFVPLNDTPRGFTQNFLTSGRGDTLAKAKLDFYKVFYGANKLSLPTKGFLDILIEQLISPFFIFQYFSVILYGATKNTWPSRWLGLHVLTYSIAV